MPLACSFAPFLHFFQYHSTFSSSRQIIIALSFKTHRFIKQEIFLFSSTSLLVQTGGWALRALKSRHTKAGSAAFSSIVLLLGCRNAPAQLSGGQGCSSDLQPVPSAAATHGHKAAHRHRVCRTGHGESVERVVQSHKKSEVSALLPKQRIVLCPLYLSCSAFSYALASRPSKPGKPRSYFKVIS